MNWPHKIYKRVNTSLFVTLYARFYKKSNLSPLEVHKFIKSFKLPRIRIITVTHARPFRKMKVSAW
jgi:hypothetical protein